MNVCVFVCMYVRGMYVRVCMYVYVHNEKIVCFQECLFGVNLCTVTRM
jgi:hypothetical protein